MIDRFSTTDVGSELIKRADELEIKLFRHDDGQISSMFKLSGSTPLPDGEDGATIDRGDEAQFLRQLMKAFEGEPK